MHSPTIFLLLSAFIGHSSGTIYWRNAPPKKAADKDDFKSRVQVQVNLVLHAYKHQDVHLLYDLIPFGTGVDRYLKSHPNQIVAVNVEEAEESNGGLRAIAQIQETSEQGANEYRAILELATNSASPTGYTINKGHICKGHCGLETGDVGFV